MSRRRKLEKFESINQMPHVFQNFQYETPTLINFLQQPVHYAGSWATLYFNNTAPIVLELACGRGEYSLGLAELFPNQNYIGVDIKGARIWQGAMRAVKKQLSQVAFLRTKIECIQHFFGLHEVETIWIIFPDPFLKSGKSNRRLTSPQFLNRFRKILSPTGTIKLKTDSPELFDFTLESIANDDSVKIIQIIEDVHRVNHGLPELDIITYYEKMHIAAHRKINFIEFSFPLSDISLDDIHNE